MKNTEAVVGWARSYAKSLEQEMDFVAVEGSPYGGYWKAATPEARSRIDARATAALAFLAHYSAPATEWSERAQQVYLNLGARHSAESGARALADLLREWADQVEHGIMEIPGVEPWAERSVASTDIMSQVRHLLEDRDVHPAAPMVLTGAAVEIALRGLADLHEVATPDHAGLVGYAQALRRARVLTQQDVKDVEQMAGLRNLAAHGQFDVLSSERAGLLEQQANLFLARLRDLSDGSPADLPTSWRSHTHTNQRDLTTMTTSVGGDLQST